MKTPPRNKGGRSRKYSDRIILAALEAAGGNKAEAVRRIGCSRNLLHQAIKRRAALREQVSLLTLRLRREGRLDLRAGSRRDAASERQAAVRASGDPSPADAAREQWERLAASQAGLPPPEEAEILAILHRTFQEYQIAVSKAAASFARVEALLEHRTARNTRAVAVAIIREMNHVLE